MEEDSKLVRSYSVYKDSEFITMEEVIDMKKTSLINKIILSRYKSIHKIIKFFKLIIQKKHFLIQKILADRKNKIDFILKNLRDFIFRQQVRYLIKKEKDHYCIKSNINNVNKLSLKVYLQEEEPKILDFEYCLIRKIYILYIPRKIAVGLSYKVNFIADSNIVIDPMYKTDYDNNGNFFNIIDFKKIDSDEFKQEQEKERIIKYIMDEVELLKEFNGQESRKRSSSFNTSSDDDYFEEGSKIKFEQKESFSATGSFKKERKSSSNRNIGFFTKSVQNILSSKNRNWSSLNLVNPIKSILKSPGSSKGTLPNLSNAKRVSFCNKIQFSVK